MLEFLLEVLLDPSGLVDLVRDQRRERRSRRRARAAGIRCAVRVVEGSHPRLGRRWARGTARVPPGVLVFESCSRGRVTIPVRTATLVPFGDVPRRVARETGGQPRLVELRTAGATLAWAVPEDQLERALSVTRPSARDAPPAAG